MRKTMTAMMVMATIIGTLAPKADAGVLKKVRKAVAKAVKHSVRDSRRHARQHIRHHTPRQRQHRQPQWTPPVRSRAPQWVPSPRWSTPSHGGTYGGANYSTGPVSRWLNRLRDPYRGHSFDYWIRMLNHHDEDDREDAAKRLGKIGDPRAIPYLEQVAALDYEDDVRDEARKAIRRILRHHD